MASATGSVSGAASLGLMMSRSILCATNSSTCERCVSVSFCASLKMTFEVGVLRGGALDVVVHLHPPRLAQVALAHADDKRILRGARVTLGRRRRAAKEKSERQPGASAEHGLGSSVSARAARARDEGSPKDPPEACCKPLRRNLGRPCGRVARTCGKVARTCAQLSRTCGKVARTCAKLSRTCGKVARTCAQLSRTCGKVARTCGKVARTCAKLSRTCAKLSRTCAQLSRTCAQLSRTCGKVARTCAKLSGTCGKLSGTCAQLSRTCAKLSGTLEIGSRGCRIRFFTCGNDFGISETGIQVAIAPPTRGASSPPRSQRSIGRRRGEASPS